MPVVTRAVVAVGRGKNRAGLSPAGTQRWVTTSVPGQKTQAVLSSPAVASRVGKVSLAAVIHSSRAFHDGCTVLLPALSRSRKNLRSANLSRRGERCNTERLKAIGHAGPDEIIAPAAEADDGTIDTPSVC